MSPSHRFDDVLSWLERHGYFVRSTTDNGELLMSSKGGQFGTLPCGEGDYIEDSVVRHNWGRLLDVDDFLGPAG